MFLMLGLTSVIFAIVCIGLPWEKLGKIITQVKYGKPQFGLETDNQYSYNEVTAWAGFGIVAMLQYPEIQFDAIHILNSF